MVRPNYRESIAQSVLDISRNQSVNELNETSMKQAVVPSLSWMRRGGAPLTLSEVEPDFQVGVFQGGLCSERSALSARAARIRIGQGVG